jgi:hypothetical protein
MISLFGFLGTLLNFALITTAAYYSVRVFSFIDGGDSGKVVRVSWPNAMLLAAVLSGSDEGSSITDAKLLMSIITASPDLKVTHPDIKNTTFSYLILQCLRWLWCLRRSSLA